MKTLREWRLSRLMTVRDLANEAGVSTRTVMEAEHSRRKPTLQTMRKLCRALNVEAADVSEFAAELESLGKDAPTISPSARLAYIPTVGSAANGTSLV